jgi:hypothetical protein
MDNEREVSKANKWTNQRAETRHDGAMANPTKFSHDDVIIAQT